MKGKEGETKRIMIPSCFALLTAGGVLGGTYCMAKGFVILGLEDWLKAGLFFGLAALAFATAISSWKLLRRHRPENLITEKLRARFRDNRGAREKFNSVLISYGVHLFLAGILVALFFVVFPRAAAQPLGERIQFLAMSGTLAAALGYALFQEHRALARYVPDEEPAHQPGEAGPPSRLRRTVAVVLTLVFAGAGAFLLVLGSSGLFSIWRIPSWGTFDIMLVYSVILGAALFCLYMAWSTLKRWWRPSQQLGPQQPVSPVYPVTNIDHSDINFVNQPSPPGDQGPFQTSERTGK